MSDVTHYVIRDREDRVVDTAPTMARAKAIARRWGTGSTVTGARGIIYTVKEAKK